MENDEEKDSENFEDIQLRVCQLMGTSRGCGFLSSSSFSLLDGWMDGLGNEGGWLVCREGTAQ